MQIRLKLGFVHVANITKLSLVSLDSLSRWVLPVESCKIPYT